jgi:SAM-dependent methyltransferase
MRYYDPNHNCLVYIERRADEDYWDEHWGMIDASMLYKPKVPPFDFVVNVTRKYLPTASLILEGGAGLAQNSWYLHLAGYRTIALDFAPKTVDFLKQHRPEVCPILGDVRDLSLDNESVDGYWSLGVIEHFCDGFEGIAREMMRVIRIDGYLFLTFPNMNSLRKLKVRQSVYPELPKGFDLNKNAFYQFALDGDQVAAFFNGIGFKLLEKRAMGGVKGFKDEVFFLKPVLQKIYDSRSLPVRAVKKLMEHLLRHWFGHTVLLVMQKKSQHQGK